MIENIQIGFLNYKIVEEEYLEDDDRQPIYGQIAYDACEIRLLASLAPSSKFATLMHEIVHGILVNAGHTGEHDEQTVSALANGFCDLLKDNPDISNLIGGI